MGKVLILKYRFNEFISVDYFCAYRGNGQMWENFRVFIQFSVDTCRFEKWAKVKPTLIFISSLIWFNKYLVQMIVNHI